MTTICKYEHVQSLDEASDGLTGLVIIILSNPVVGQPHRPAKIHSVVVSLCAQKIRTTEDGRQLTKRRSMRSRSSQNNNENCENIAIFAAFYQWELNISSSLHSVTRGLPLPPRRNACLTTKYQRQLIAIIKKCLPSWSSSWSSQPLWMLLVPRVTFDALPLTLSCQPSLSLSPLSVSLSSIENALY
jgi:hypothetical protein